MPILRQRQVEGFLDYLRENPEIRENLVTIANSLWNAAGGPGDNGYFGRAAVGIKNFLELLEKEDEEEINPLEFFRALMMVACLELQDQSLRRKFFPEKLDRAVELVGWPPDGPYLSEFQGQPEHDGPISQKLSLFFWEPISEGVPINHMSLQ